MLFPMDIQNNIVIYKLICKLLIFLLQLKASATLVLNGGKGIHLREDCNQITDFVHRIYLFSASES
jgi:hypothetical protein